MSSIGKILEGLNPVVGKANGYTGTIKIEPTSSCKGIPKGLYKYIRNINIESPDWMNKPIGFDVKGGKVIVQYEIKKPIVVEYNFGEEFFHTTNAELSDSMNKKSESNKEKFLEDLKSAGWSIVEK